MNITAERGHRIYRSVGGWGFCGCGRGYLATCDWVPPPMPEKTLQEVREIVESLIKDRRMGYDPEKRYAATYRWHRARQHHLMGDQAAAMDVDKAIAEYEAGQA